MAENEEKDNPSDSAMPSPPDLAPLYREQADKFDKVYKASSDAFNVFRQRDAQFAALTAAYQQEIVKVLTIAAAVTTPPTAIASVPVVLKAANEAFAKAPVLEQAVKAMIEEAFSAFKSE